MKKMLKVWNTLLAFDAQEAQEALEETLKKKGEAEKLSHKISATTAEIKEAVERNHFRERFIMSIKGTEEWN